MRRVAMSLCLVVVMLSFVSRTSAESGQWTNDAFHFSISWEGNWHEVSRRDSTTDYARISLRNDQIIYQWYGIFTNRTDPKLVAQDFVDRFRSIDSSQIVQTMSPGGASGPLPEIIAYPDQDRVTTYEYIKAFMSGITGLAYVEILGTSASDTTTPVQQLLQDIHIERSFPTNGSISATATASHPTSSTAGSDCSGYADWRNKTEERIQTLQDILTNLQNGLNMPGLFRTGEVGMVLDRLMFLESEILNDEPPLIAQNVEPYFQQALTFYASAVRQLSFQPSDQMPIFTPEITGDFNNGDAYMSQFIAEFVRIDGICG